MKKIDSLNLRNIFLVEKRGAFFYLFFSCCLILEKAEVRSEEIFNLAFAVHADQCLADGGHRHLARGASATTVIEATTR